MYDRPRAINQLKQCVFPHIVLLGKSDDFLDPEGCRFTSDDDGWLMVLPAQSDGLTTKQYAVGYDGRLYRRHAQEWLAEDLDQQPDQVWQEVARVILEAFADSSQRQAQVCHHSTDIIIGETRRMIQTD